MQGLNVEIQDALVTARVDTYAEIVKMAQRIENNKVKVREFKNVRRFDPKSWVNKKARPSQGPTRSSQRASGRLPQKRMGGFSTAQPAKSSLPSVLCGCCCHGNHS